MNKNKAVILAKLESTYGTDPTPVASTDALLVYDLDVKVSGKRLERRFLKPSYGNADYINSGESIDVTFKIDCTGVLTDSNAPPPVGKLLEACNMTETISEGVRATYAVNSLQDTAKSLTFYYYLDGLLHKVSGARGNMKIDLVPGELAMFEFSFKGLYNADHASVASMVTPTWPTDPARIFKDADVVINSVTTYGVSKVSVDLGNDVQLIPNANAATGFGKIVVAGRNLSGNVGIHATNAVTWWDAYKNSSQWDMTFSIYMDGTDTIDFAVNNLKIDVPNYADVNSILMHDINYTAAPSAAGNNEFSIIFPIE